jgi:hypothetical protein
MNSNESFHAFNKQKLIRIAKFYRSEIVSYIRTSSYRPCCLFPSIVFLAQLSPQVAMNLLYGECYLSIVGCFKAFRTLMLMIIDLRR